MTDHPRFMRVKGGPDSAYRNYHGAALVGWVLHLADSVSARRHRTELPAQSNPVVRMSKPGFRPRAVVGLGLALVSLYFGGRLLFFMT